MIRVVVVGYCLGWWCDGDDGIVTINPIIIVLAVIVCDGDASSRSITSSVPAAAAVVGEMELLAAAH